MGARGREEVVGVIFTEDSFQKRRGLSNSQHDRGSGVMGAVDFFLSFLFVPGGGKDERENAWDGVY